MVFATEPAELGLTRLQEIIFRALCLAPHFSLLVVFSDEAHFIIELVIIGVFFLFGHQLTG